MIFPVQAELDTWSAGELCLHCRAQLPGGWVVSPCCRFVTAFAHLDPVIRGAYCRTVRPRSDGARSVQIRLQLPIMQPKSKICTISTVVFHVQETRWRSTRDIRAISAR